MLKNRHCIQLVSKKFSFRLFHRHFFLEFLICFFLTYCVFYRVVIYEIYANLSIDNNISKFEGCFLFGMKFFSCSC